MSDNKKVVISANCYTEYDVGGYGDPYDVLSVIVTADDGYPDTYTVGEYTRNINDFDFSKCYFREGAKELYESFLKV